MAAHRFNIARFLIYFFMTIGSGAAKSYGGEIVTRLLLGFAGGADECLAPLTITDIFISRLPQTDSARIIL
jgi:hypothetical protein